MGIKGIKPISIGFLVTAKETKGKNGRTKVELSAVPSGHFFTPNAELLASIKNHKKKFTYTNELKELLKKLHWDKSTLQPVKKFMQQQLDQVKRIETNSVHMKIIKISR